MAKPVTKGGTTKVRFLMLEAEGNEADLSQIFAAIQNAVKPATTVVQQRLAPSPGSSAILAVSEATSDIVSVDEGGSDEEEYTPPAAKSARDSKPRSYTKPEVLDGVDLNSDVSFEEFANRKRPENDKDRFLVIAAWWSEHRQEANININHVYTCYKKMRWPSAIADFAWPLRSLKKEGLMKSGGRGLYAINHIGIGRVE